MTQSFKIKSGIKLKEGPIEYDVKNLQTGKVIHKKGTLIVLSCYESTSAYIKGTCYQAVVKERVQSLIENL
jgi:hypothetical protein